MQISPQGLVFTRQHEGFVDHAYYDSVNVLTIGIGFTWLSKAFRTWWARNRPGEQFTIKSKMTRAEAEQVLKLLFDDQYGQAVDTFLNKTVPQHVFDGMASAVFNLGEGALKWKWAVAAQHGEYANSAQLLSVTGTTANGTKLAGLVKRRADEAELIRYGDYTYGPMTTKEVAAVKDSMADGILVRGERGPVVKQLIEDLHTLGFYNGVADDVFGYGTEAAVLAFQRANKLDADGEAGPKTLSLINSQVSKRATSSAAAVAEPAHSVVQPIQGGNWLAGLLAVIVTFIRGRNA